MSAATGIRISLIVFVVAILQVSVFSSIAIGGSPPDVLLVTLVVIALFRGAVVGAVIGFAAGLIVDTATLGTLGLTSLPLTLAGYWAGRYGETTGRGRPHAPFAATVAATVFVQLGGSMLDSLLGGPLALGPALLALPAGVIWSAVLTYPVVVLVRRFVGTTEKVERSRGVELLV